ncbi:MAG TPA: hypothetical protein VGB47_10905 [Thermoanaerobaculia bacterium]|jgi:hypothetical protein
MRKNLLMVSLAACCAFVLSSSVALAAENWLGTWKLDVAKSKYSPGPAPKSLTLKFEATADGIKLTSDGVNAEGNPTHGEYVSKFDGKDVPWKGNPDADTAAAKKIDDNSYENVWKKDGKTTIIAKAVVSKSGKTLTVTLTGTNAKGQTVNNTAVYDRQ